MAVQVPRLERFPVQPEPSVGRIQGQAPDFLQSQQLESRAVQQFGAGLIDASNRQDVFMKKQEELTADTVSDNAAANYHKAMITKLTEADKIEGDPSSVYNDFDQFDKDFSKNIIEENSKASPVVQLAVKKKLAEAQNRIYDKKITARSDKQTKWELGVKENSLSIDRAEMASSIKGADRNDPASLDLLGADVDRIKDRVLRYGAKVGRNPDDPVLAVETSKHLNEGLKAAMTNLSSSGKVDAAKFAYEKFSDYLSSDTKDDLTNIFEKDRVKHEANKLFDDYRILPESQAIAKANENIKDVEVRLKLIDDLHSYNTKMKVNKKEADDISFNQIGKIITDKKVAGEPFVDANTMWKDSVISKLAENLSPHDRKTVESMVESKRKESKASALADMYHAHTNLTFEGMTPMAFEKMAVGLNDRDYNTYRKLWENTNSDTESEQVRRESRISAKLISQLKAIKYLEPKRTSDEDAKYAQIASQVQQDFKTISKSDVSKQDQWVKEVATKMKAGEKLSFTEKATKFIKDVYSGEYFFGGDGKPLPLVSPTTTTIAPDVTSTSATIPGTTTTTVAARAVPQDIKFIATMMKRYETKYGKKATKVQLEQFMQEEAK